MYQQLFLAIPKKPGGKDRRRPNNGNMKYGIRFLRKAKEESHFDNENGNYLWDNTILKELEALMSMTVSRNLLSSLRKARVKGYQFTPLRMIFDVKVDLRIQTRLVIGGHVVDSSGDEVYANTMKSVLSRTLMKIADANDLEIMTGDIGNVYLNANTKEKIYIRAGAEFELVGIMAEGNLLEVVKALYGLPTRRNRRHTHLSYTLREMS